MGPNSGGGRKNGGAPNVAARARFSTWKPTKGNGGGGNDNSEGRSSKKKVDMTKLGNSKSRVASSISVASTRVKSSSAGLAEWIDINAIETINLSRDLLTKIFKYMNSNGNMKLSEASGAANLSHNDAVNCPAGLSLSSNVRPRIVVTVRSEDTSASDKQKSIREIDLSRSSLPVYIGGASDETTPDADSNIKELEEKLSKLKLAKQNKLNKLANPNNIGSNSIETGTSEQTELYEYFQTIGFTTDEILRNKKVILSRYNLEDIPRDSLFLAMLADISHQTIVGANSSGTEIAVDDMKQMTLIKKAKNNIDLTDECDVLKSIYEDATSTRMVFILNSICCFLELSLTEKDLNIPSKNSSSDKKLSNNNIPALCIQFIIFKAGNIFQNSYFLFCFLNFLLCIKFYSKWSYTAKIFLVR